MMGAGSATNATYLTKELNFSKTVLNHTERPYSRSQLLAKEIMKSKNPVVDSGGLLNGLKWTVEGSFNGTLRILGTCS